MTLELMDKQVETTGRRRRPVWDLGCRTLCFSRCFGLPEGLSVARIGLDGLHPPALRNAHGLFGHEDDVVAMVQEMP